jgi:hypothetical protein
MAGLPVALRAEHMKIGVRCACVALCATAGVGCAGPAWAGWSAPARLSGCAVASSLATVPVIVYPSSNPQTRSGPGLLLWSAPANCRAGASDPGEAVGAALGTGGLPGAGRPLDTAGGLAGVAGATGTALGQVLVVGPRAAVSSGSRRGGGGVGVESGTGGAEAGSAGIGDASTGDEESEGALTEGTVAGAFAPAQPLGGPAAPLAVFSAYLGDALIVSTAPTRQVGREDLAVRIQRHYSHAPAAPRLLPAGRGRVSAVTGTMDYRSDTLLLWARAGGIYARELTEAGVLEPTQRIGGSTSEPELRAVVSDDGRAIVAWRSQSRIPGGTETSIELSISGPGMRFSEPPRPVERFRDPAAGAPAPGGLCLVRLSSEAVMMAWSGLSEGRYIVRCTPVSLRRGAWAPVTVSTPGAEAMLADLVPGSDADALALWTSAPLLPDGRLDLRRQRILAARGHYAGQGEVSFQAPEALTPRGLYGTPTAAVDPQTDRPLVAWVEDSSGSPRIAYAQGSARAATPIQASRESSAILIGTPLAAWRK